MHALRSGGIACTLQSLGDVGDRFDLRPCATPGLLNLFRRRRPRIVGPGGDHPVGQRKQDLGHL